MCSTRAAPALTHPHGVGYHRGLTAFNAADAMPAYSFEALDAQGHVRRGTLDADSPRRRA